jgi:hypothetical protein
VKDLEQVICCLNIKESYIRITNHFKGHPYIGFEEFIDDIDEVKNKSMYKRWQYAVVDKKLPWYEEAVKFFKKNNVEIIYFLDDYREVISSIKDKVSPPPEDELKEKGGVNTRQDSERVRYIDKPVTKIVERKVYTGIEKRFIGVANLAKGSGATTITLCLAKYLSGKNILSSIIEPPIASPTIFNWMGIEEREEVKGESGDGFYSYPHEIMAQNRIKNKAEYIFDDICWIVPDDRKKRIKEWGYPQMLQLLYVSAISPITLIDIGDNLFHQSIKPLISVLDLVLVVIDPFPTNCKINDDKFLRILKLKNEGCPIKFIINKWNKGIDKKEFLDFLGEKPAAFIPAIDLALLYKANCHYEIPLCYSQVSELLEAPLHDICSNFIPKGFVRVTYRKKHGKNTLFFNIKKKLMGANY